MASSFNSYAANIAQSMVLYMGMSTVIIGILGNTLNLLVFLSLKTFRENSCAFYLTLMSFVNIGHLITGQLTRVMITGFDMDWTQSSLFYCKFRPFGLQLFGFISLTCMCLATMDQFFATCNRVYWQQLSNIKLAHRLGGLSIIIWILYCIPYLIYYNLNVSLTTGATNCSFTNQNFRQYHSYMNNIVLSGFLPLIITVLLGTLAYKNVRQIAYRAVPLVRRELDKQLTNMVLIQIIFSFCTILPYIVLGVIPLTTNINSDPISSAYFTIAIHATACIYYLNYAYPCYIYICVSKRFRQQLIYVLFYLRSDQKQRAATNQILPLPI